jgi:type IV pilus assembly protein PilC
MPTYLYTARDETGQMVNGTLAAATIDEVGRMLRAERKYPVNVRLAGGGGGSSGGAAIAAAGVAGDPGLSRPSGGVKIRRADLIHLSTQLSVMLETGVTLTEALECIGRQAKVPKFMALVADLSHAVQGGSDFSAAISRHPRSFPRLYISLMRAAEKSGTMSKMLLRATSYLRDEQDTMRRVKGALTYPAIMLGFAILTTVFLLAFVLPRFAAIYANKGAALPLPTRILMDASHVLVNHWVAVCVTVAGAVTFGIFFFRSEAGVRSWHWTQLRLPIMGTMYRKLHLSRGLRMMGTLGASGVNLLDCVENTIDACGNVYYRALWQGVSQRIQSGKPMSEPIGQSQLVPGEVAQMMASGERSGKLTMVMDQIASYTEMELKEKIVELTRYIEPAMIVIMGCLIGGVALALMLPVFTMGKVVAS